LVFELKGLRDSLAQSPDEEKNMDSFRTAAQFFQKNVRTTDLVSYLGGESFVIFTPEQGEGKEYLIERLRTIFKNMKADLGPLQLDQEMKLKVRAIDYPGDRGIVQELLRDAVEVL